MSPTHHRDALNQTFQLFNIKAKEIAIEAGILETQINRFRTGKTDLYAETLFAIVKQLPLEARAYFLALVMTSGDILASGVSKENTT